MPALPEPAAERAGSWLVPLRTPESATVRLLCFPYAGAGAGLYRAWADLLPPEVELWGFQAPGRENRIGETPTDSVLKLVEQAARGLESLPPKPVALFGHSLGALLAYETACALRTRGDKSVRVLIVSGYRAPQLDPIRPPIAHLSDTEFMRAIVRLNGTPPEVFAHRELAELLLPMLRADFRIADTYRPPSREPLSVPIVALGSDGDAHAGRESIEAWRTMTAGGFTSHQFDGDHFYLNARRDELVAYVARAVLRT